ncbi:MAG: NADH-quinone oxidoreductase subunit NuoH [Acidimicrobiia bacterium]|nr:NADH-quinone oxidoreductase subunit NuoH [Acidimicrobiia bacterium]
MEFDGWTALIGTGTVVAVFVVVMLMVILAVWAERRVAAVMQTRIGPNRAGPFGLLQTIADGIKLLMKESITPRQVDRLVYELAPLLAVLPAFLALAIVPFGPGFCIGGQGTDCSGGYFVDMQIANLNVGVLWFLSMSAIGVYAALLAGWGSGSKYPLLGGVRASAQVISYEAALSLSVVPVVVAAGTLDTQGIVLAQSQYRWFLLPLFIPALFFFVAALAETNRPPFDLVEAESELVGGFHTEYSGVRFMLFFLAEYVNVVTISALFVTFFLGGWTGPYPVAGSVNWAPLFGAIWFLAKTVCIIGIFFWLRVTLPRLRYDQLMALCWKRLIPINLVYLMAVAVWVAYQATGDLPRLVGGG